MLIAYYSIAGVLFLLLTDLHLGLMHLLLISAAGTGAFLRNNYLAHFVFSYAGNIYHIRLPRLKSAPEKIYLRGEVAILDEL